MSVTATGDMILTELKDISNIKILICSRVSHSEAKELRARNSKVFPLKSRFAQLPNLLLDNGFYPGTFDGILIDVAGCSAQQWADPRRGDLTF